jgi:cell division protein ZapA (FtsZ GTPase activity inhibitor)
MSNVDVSLLSRPFNIACKLEQQDALHSAAKMLDSELHSLRDSMTHGVEFEKLVVTAALNFCGRYGRLVAEFEDYMTAIIDTNNELSQQLADMPNPAEFIKATMEENGLGDIEGAEVASSSLSAENSSADESVSESAESSFEFQDSYDKPLTGFDAGMDFSPFEDDELDIDFEPSSNTSSKS